jgi:flavin reductase (DIM6/NTAB) family NADH-FMN oxidoreductase RutF
MHESLLQGKCFAINVLRADQEATSRQFAMPGPKDFSGLSLTVAKTGAPILVNALAFVDCRLVEILSGGDHDMFLGDPVAGEARDGEPLIFYSGGYTQLTPLIGEEGKS